MRVDLLSKWFQKNKREFPWRNDKNPYRVWVSEVMLQQTQARVVVEYFQKWMSLFPDLNTLASADLSQVLKVWEGLGYYSRAKRLYEGARQVMTDYGGCLPEEEKLLAKIPGIGPYTLGAILSFAFEKKKPAVDGNVIRVITRLFGIQTPIEKAATKQLIYNKVLEILPEEKPYEIMEGLIELGAMICKKNPICHKCPLKQSCQAFALKDPHLFPVSMKKVVIEKIQRHVYIYVFEKKILVKTPEQTASLMGHLHQFPFCAPTSENNETAYLKNSRLLFSCEETFCQSFTKYQVTLLPFVYECQSLFLRKGYVWLNRQELALCTFSSGDRKILHWIFSKDLL